MSVLGSFNFDIIIILILISSTISGLYFNLYKQGKKTLSLFLPFVVLAFSFNYIYQQLNDVSFLKNIINWIINLFGIETYQETIYATVIYFVCFFILWLFIRLIYNLFRISVQKRVLNKQSKSSKAISSFFGLINGYVLGMLLMFGLNPVITLNYSKPLTAVYVRTSNNLLQFSNLNLVKNVNTSYYIDYDNTIGQLTGRTALDNYKDILSIFQEIEDEETNFMDNIYPNLMPEAKSLINSTDVFNSLLENKDKIVQYQKGTEVRKELKRLIKNLENKNIYIYLNKQLTDYSYQGIFDYLELNYNYLLEKINSRAVKDQFIFKYESFKNYNESKLDYQSIINYTSISFEEDVSYYEDYINSNTNEFIEKFNLHNQTNESELFEKLDLLFKKYLKQSEKMEEESSFMPLSSKLVFSDHFNYHFKKNLFERNELIRVYLVDSIVNQKAKGYYLYSEYVFFTILSEDVDLDNMTKSEFIKILDNLDSLVESEHLTKDDASEYLYNLFANDRHMFFNLLDASLINEIKEIESEYFSQKLYILLD